MRTALKIAAAALITASMAAPAFARGGGGGWPANIAMTKVYAGQHDAACSLDSKNCIGPADLKAWSAGE
jgi:hypothetical protein